jgi:hypothetical protein
MVLDSSVSNAYGWEPCLWALIESIKAPASTRQPIMHSLLPNFERHRLMDHIPIPSKRTLIWEHGDLSCVSCGHAGPVWRLQSFPVSKRKNISIIRKG